MLFVNGHNLYVEQNGPENGPVVILMHHGLGSVRAWKRQTNPLADAGFRVIAYDRWGYGGSDVRHGLDLPSFCTDINDLNALLEQMNIKRATLVGHSDGGTIALYFAAQQPERVQRLVAVAAHIYVEPKIEPGIMGIKQAFETDERFRKRLKRAHGDKYETVFHNWYDGWYRIESLSWDMRPVPSQIKCRALIVHGEKDEYASAQHAIDIAACIPDAEIWIIPGAGHMAPQENADEFNARILRFLKYETAGE